VKHAKGPRGDPRSDDGQTNPPIAGKETNHRRPAPTTAAQGTKTPALTPEQQFTVNAYESLLRTSPRCEQIQRFLFTNWNAFPPETQPFIDKLVDLSPEYPPDNWRIRAIASVIHGFVKKKAA
jgi:hypothetical protein